MNLLSMLLVEPFEASVAGALLQATRLLFSALQSKPSFSANTLSEMLAQKQPAASNINAGAMSILSTLAQQADGRTLAAETEAVALRVLNEARAHV